MDTSGLREWKRKEWRIRSRRRIMRRMQRKKKKRERT